MRSKPGHNILEGAKGAAISQPRATPWVTGTHRTRGLKRLLKNSTLEGAWL